MRELKSDIIHAIYQCSGVDNDKLVEVSNICDKFQSRLDAKEKIINMILSRLEEKDFKLPSVEECESNLVDTGGQQLTTDERWAVEETYHFIESQLKGTL